MVQEHRGPFPAQHAGQSYLAPSRWQQVLAADDQVHLVPIVVHHHGELIGPIAGAVPEEHIAALLRGRLRDHSKQRIGEGFRTGLHQDADAPPVGERKAPVAAAAGVPRLLVEEIPRLRGDVPAGATAGVHPRRAGQLLQRSSVGAAAVALAVRRGPAAQLRDGAEIRREAQPLQVLQGGRFVFGPRPAPVMVLQPKQHSATEGARDPPHVDRVGRVAEMQVPGGARCESGDRAGWKQAAERGQVERHGGKDRLAHRSCATSGPRVPLYQASSTRERTPVHVASRGRPPRNSK